MIGRHPDSCGPWRHWGLALLGIAHLAIPAAAQDSNDSPTIEDWAAHVQATGVFQWHPPFAAPYSGPNSLDPKSQHNETTDVTAYLGWRPWGNAELWVNPELDQGFGLSNTLGAAGFVSGEAYKVGEHRPYVRIPRLFLRQTINLDDQADDGLDAGLNQLAGRQSADRIVVTVGKFAVTDLFDTNQYAGDARNQFLNWALINDATFDYAADAWGFTYGATAEWYQGRWALRSGLFTLSSVPNSKALDTTPFDQTETVLELEERHQWADQPGKLRVTWYDNVGRMGSYAAAVSQADADGTIPSTADVRQRHSKQGVGLNGEQQLTDDLGAFARVGWSQGKYEAFEFTDVNQAESAGLTLAGNRWQRPDDTVGLAVAVNRISGAGKRYLAAGGLGILVGDGQLADAGAEEIIETYYSVSLSAWAKLTFDYQFLRNPAYNADRGPVSVLAGRIHLQY